MKPNQKSNLISNIDFSEEWLIKEIIKTDFEEKQTGKIRYLRIRRIDLLNLVLKFIKLNRKGE